jgi:transketolase
MCYYAALERKHGPSSLIFSRQNVPVLTRPSSWSPDEVLKGGYIIKDVAKPALVIVATGSEVGLALETAALMDADGTPTRVVSMPCVELFRAQPDAYRNQLIPHGVRTAVIEAGTTKGWSSLLDREVVAVGIDHYGASAPGEVLAEKFGFTPAAVKAKLSA